MTRKELSRIKVTSMNNSCQPRLQPAIFVLFT